MDASTLGQSAPVRRLSVADLDVGLAGGPLRTKEGLRRVHEMLVRTAPSTEEPPLDSLLVAASLVGPDLDAMVMSLPPRPRTVFRLLAAGAYEAAWVVLASTAVGTVEDLLTESNALQVATANRRLPLLTLVEAPQVYADLPGFRDPRYGAPDSCYDITDLVSLSQGIEELTVTGATLSMAGWAALRLLAAGADEQVRLVATRGEAEVVALGRRVWRADAITGTAPGSRHGWNGWAVALDTAKLARGSWSLFLDVDHRGVVRRAPIGSRPSALVRSGARAVTAAGTASLRWATDDLPWRLVVADSGADSGEPRGGAHRG